MKKQMDVARWLKGITVMAGVIGLFFFLLVMPWMAGRIADACPEAAYLKVPGLVYGWGIGALCYALLYQFWKVCVQIGEKNSFSVENERSFRKICGISAFTSAVWVAGAVFLAAVRCLGLMCGFTMLLIAFFFAILAVLAAALSRLIDAAYEIRRENELTI